jgi:outer membrane protein insertion porin family
MRKGTRTFIGLLAWIFLLAGALSSGGVTVEEILVRSEASRKEDRAFVLAHIATRPGDELDRFRISEDVDALLRTERFSHVGVKVRPVEDGRVRLVYEVANRLKLVDPVVVKGAEHFSDGKVREFMKLRPGDLIDRHVAGVAARRVKKKYAEDYFKDAEVEPRVEKTGKGKCRLTVEIAEGRRVPVEGLIFEGNENLSYDQLRKPFEQPAWWNPFKWFLRKKKYDDAELETARLAVENMYRAHGFLQVEVDTPERIVDKDGDLFIRVEIEEGPKFRVGEVDIKGADLFPVGELMQRVKIDAGDIASSQAIRMSAGAINDYYGRRGYIDTVARPYTGVGDDSNTVDVVFRIQEGEQVSIHNVRISGNQKTKDKVIRRELLVYPGDVYDEVAINRSERRLQNLGFFSSVRSFPEKTREPDRRNVIFEVEEKPTGQFMVGAGFSSVENLIGFVQVQQGNFDITGWPYFTGGGQKLKLAAEFGSTTESYELSFVEPWFLDQKLSLGVDLYRKNLSYDDYDLEQTGGALSIRRSLPGPNSLTARYKLEDTQVNDVSDTNRYIYADSPGEEFFFTREEDVLQSSLRVSLIHDTRNSPFVPTRGTRASVFADVSGGVLGFDTDIYRLGLNVDEYIPIWLDHVVAFNSRFEVVDAYAGTDEVAISDRLFLGGGRTIRGFEYREVGPKVVRPGTGDPDSDSFFRPVGGKSLALGTLEYWIPLVPKIRFAAFMDIGNVWRDSYDFDFSELAATYGAGVRLDLPGFPVRIDWAWPAARDDELTDEERFVFWIGYER